MVSRHKNVDSIASPKIVKGKPQYHKATERNSDEPLLNILNPEPEHGHSKDFVMPNQHKKWYIWTRKSKTNKKDKVESKKSAINADRVIPTVFSEKTRDQKPKVSVGSASTTADAAGKAPGWQKRHRVAFVLTTVASTLLVLLGLFGGAAYAHQSIYQNKVFPGVSVWGQDVGGMNVVDVQKIITDKAKSYNIVIKGPDQDYRATVSDLGIIFNTDSMALSAYSRGRSGVWYDDYLTRARLLLTEVKWAPFQDFVRAKDLAISPSYNVNQEKLNAYLTKLSDNIKIQAQDSQVTVEGGKTQLKPAIYGRSVEYDTLKKAVLGSISGLTSDKIDVKTTVVKPAIVDNAAQDVMLQAQNVMSRAVILTYKGVEYRPNQDTVGSWISFTKNEGDVKYTLVVDQSKMASYFSFLGSKINIGATQRIVRVENGVKQTEAQAGADGLLVDSAILGQQIAATLPLQSSVRLEIPTYVDKFKTKYENVVIADWDKYIDINLTSQTMTACQRGGVNCRQWSVTTGKDGMNTPVGTHLVLGRNASFYMTGGTPGIDYYKVWVDTAVWFTSAGHAVHDASWRNGSFGGQDYHWNGSHGCVNSPDEAATYIFNWAPVGTPVVVHY